MTKYEIIYRNAETSNECNLSYDADTLLNAIDTALFFRRDDEEVYVMNTETGETIYIPEGFEV